MLLNGAFSRAKTKRIIVFVVLALVAILFSGCDFLGGHKEEFFLIVNWVEEHGQVFIQPNQGKYEKGTKVNLLASPLEGWKFSHWEGDAEGTEPETLVIMNSDKSITATFIKGGYSLAVKTEGGGTVAIKPEKEIYSYGDQVELTPLPFEGWGFSEWTGEKETKEDTINITITRDTVLTAIFLEIFTFNIEIEGEGLVVRDPSESEYLKGTIVELEAIPGEGWYFSCWQDGIEGSERITQVVMDADKLIRAVFKEEEYNLTVSTIGSGIVVKNPEKDSYLFGDPVTLTAEPETDWNFSHWEGDAEGTAEEIDIIMNSDKNITAYFTRPGAQASGTITIEHNWPRSAVEQGLESRNKTTQPGKENVKTMGLENYKPGEMIIKFHPVTAQADMDSVFRGLNLEVIDQLKSLNAYLVKTPGQFIEAEIEMARMMGGVLYAGPNYTVRACIKLPDDPLYVNQWNYPQIRLPQAWNITTGSSDIRIAVLDTGVDAGHPDLGENVAVALGYNFIDDNSNTNDFNGHGTHVAGTIGANTNNNEGVAGVMWGCTIIPVKVLDDNGSGSTWEVASGILYAAGLEEPYLTEPAHIINLSLGGPDKCEVMEEAVQKAEKKGVIMVAASGNNNSSGELLYPAEFPETIAVGAVNYNYQDEPQRAYYSNNGPLLDVVAPGGDGTGGILSTYFSINGNKVYNYDNFIGTSMATAHVSGAIGLMLSGGIQTNEVREILHNTSMDLGEEGFDEEYGHGLINTYWAVNNVQNIKVLVGNRKGNVIDTVLETKIDLRSQAYEIEGIPGGEYRIYAWIDVKRNGVIEPGDYLAGSHLIDFNEEGEVDLVLLMKEVD